AVRKDPGDFAAVGKREPEGAVFTHRNIERLTASTDRDTFDWRRLGCSATAREDECGDSACEFETELTRAGDEACHGGFEEMKINFHGAKRFGGGLRIATNSKVTPL